MAVARDGRTTGDMLADAVKAGLAAVGCEVVDLGIAATPTIGYYVKTSAPAAACRSPPVTIAGMERASSCFARKDSCCLRGRTEVVEAYEAPAREVRFVGRSEEREDGSRPHEPHLEKVLHSSTSKEFGSGGSVAFDCNHGSGGTSVQGCSSLGCEFTVQGGVPDGRFEHPRNRPKRTFKVFAMR